MFNKLGVSPIIATMLLVALAIAIGASLVSYAGFYFEKKPAGLTGCRNYMVNLLELDKSREYCVFQFKVPIAFKLQTTPKKVENNCYLSIASGTTKICDVSESFVDKTWVVSETEVK